jgi:excisionase family DNA binding protein
LPDISSQLDQARERLRIAHEPLRPFFTPRTLAEYLSISERTARQLLADGEITSYLVGGSRRVDPADVDSYLRHHRQRHLKQA